eukprot:scaffold144184_cov154-Phaeocystis_antarctica.AAC.1
MKRPAPSMLGLSAPTPIVFAPGRIPTAAKNGHDDDVTLVGIAPVYTGSSPQLRRGRRWTVRQEVQQAACQCSWFNVHTAYYACSLVRRSALLAVEPAHALSSSMFISANMVSLLAARSYSHPSSSAVLPG